MKLLSVHIEGLFNIFTHNIFLNQEDRITIITAPNGYGKTIALKTIYSLFNRKFTFFNELIFNKISYVFDNGRIIEIYKKNVESEQKTEFLLKENGRTIESFEYPSKRIMKDLERIPLHILEDFTPNFIRRIAQNQWLNELTNEVLSLEDILFQFNDDIPERFTERLNFDIPKKFSEIINVIEVYFIQEQRLVLREPISDHRMRREIVITDTIEKYSQELSKLIKQKIGEYAQITQSLDSSFPKRLFQQSNTLVEVTDLKDKLNALQEKRQKISKYGLLKVDDDTSMFSNENVIAESETKVLSLYLADNEEKLSVFDSIVHKIELFTQILNERRFNFKSIEIDKEKGFIFKTSNDSHLKLTDLSSGEQHEVVLLYELLFKAKENSLVLIDEPEISLHVVWQKAFLDDIQEIINLQKIDVVIATHSPQIINDRWELTVNLEASVGSK